MLKVQNVIKFYGKKSMFRDKRIPVVKGVSFDCPTGASVAIIGESGSGKSTLSRMILGLEKPDQGQVTLDGQPVHLKKSETSSNCCGFSRLYFFFASFSYCQRYFV